MDSHRQPSIAECLDRIAEAEKALAAARQALSVPVEPVEPVEPEQEQEEAAEPQHARNDIASRMCDQAVTDALNAGAMLSPTGSRQTGKLSDVQSWKNVGVAVAAASGESVIPGDVSWEWCCGCCRVPMFVPEHKKVVMWSILSFVFIVYLVFATPFSVAFEADPVHGGFFWYLNQAINVYFILDLPLNFLICFRDPANGNLVRHPGLVARKYLSSWFALDFFTAVPWDQLPFACGGAMQMAKSVRVLRISRVLRALRLFKLLKAGSLMDRVSMMTEADPTLMFLLGISKILLLLLSVTHWAACGWYIVGMMKTDEDASWVDAKLEGRNDIWQRYLYSVYFTLTTMTTVGYGDITPQNFSEVCFALALLLIASLVFAGLLGALTDLVNTVSASKHQMQERKRMLGLYGRYRELPISLFRPMRQHLMWLWETQGGFDDYEDSLKTDLPPILRRELCFHIYGETLKDLRSAPFLSWMHSYDAVLKELATMVSSSWLSSGDHIFRVGEPNDKIYILRSGVARLSVNERLIDQAEPASPGGGDFGGEFDALSAPSRISARNLGSEEDMKTAEKAADIPHPVAMQRAATMLLDLDRKRAWAASFIQYRWRSNRASDRKYLGSTTPRSHRWKSRGSPLTSKSVRAPAYFGEVCLWHPMDTWETSPPPPFRYSARCETRAELVVIQRTQIHELLQRFSPWLGKRFNFYRDALEAVAMACSVGARALGTIEEPRSKSGVPGLEEAEGGGFQQLNMREFMCVPLPADHESPTHAAGSFSPGSLRQPLLAHGPPQVDSPSSGGDDSDPYERSRYNL